MVAPSSPLVDFHAELQIADLQQLAGQKDRLFGPSPVDTDAVAAVLVDDDPVVVPQLDFRVLPRHRRVFELHVGGDVASHTHHRVLDGDGLAAPLGMKSEDIHLERPEGRWTGSLTWKSYRARRRLFGGLSSPLLPRRPQ